MVVAASAASRAVDPGVTEHPGTQKLRVLLAERALADVDGEVAEPRDLVAVIAKEMTDGA
ncbi:hypothetical protein AB0C06_18275 [Micromonospora inaquosa]|uniref:hypothetical protein n=1 Tax=Micromonospora inaquosa TaxID=2203716 RepID=UPI0033C205E1